MREYLLGFKPKIRRVGINGDTEAQAVFVKELDGAAGEALWKSLKARRDVSKPELQLAHWVVYSACDESGEPIFEPGDLEAVSQMPLPIVQTIAREAMAINGEGKEATAELVKN
ncbi:MAG: hypothetical protein GTO41_20010 [Burkholderiales bacterium]|nr:hypothetical protein [Burkholderiales bacterium]